MKLKPPVILIARVIRAAILLLTLLQLTGCVERRERLQEEVFPLTVLFIEFPDLWPKVGIPEDIIAISSPLQSKSCPNVVFLGELTLRRLPDAPKREEVIQTHAGDRLRGWFRRLYGARPGLEQLRREVQSYLRGKSVSPDFSATAPNAEPVTDEAVVKYISEHPAQKIFVISSGGTDVSIAVPEGKTLAAVGVPDKLTAELANDLCRDHGKPGAKTPRLVIYGSRLLAPSKPPRSPLQPTSNVQPTCNQLYNDLVALLDRPISGDRKPIDERFREAMTVTCPQDYRFPYERARLAAGYGRARHDAAFAQLFAAAERAIATGDADKMLEALSRDAAQGGSFDAVRSHEEWQTVVEALKTRCRSCVRR